MKINMCSCLFENIKTYELDGRLNDKDWSMRACQEVVRRFTAHYPDFLGARVIFTVHR